MYIKIDRGEFTHSTGCSRPCEQRWAKLKLRARGAKGKRGKKIAVAARTPLWQPALCVIVQLSAFPYLPRPIARLYLIKPAASFGREPFSRRSEMRERNARRQNRMISARGRKWNRLRGNRRCSRCYARVVETKGNRGIYYRCHVLARNSSGKTEEKKKE